MIFRAAITAYFYADDVDDARQKLAAEIARGHIPEILLPGSEILIEPEPSDSDDAS